MGGAYPSDWGLIVTAVSYPSSASPRFDRFEKRFAESWKVCNLLLIAMGGNMTEKFGNSFSDVFGIDENWLKKNSVFNPTLDVDSPLFVDPFLLPNSAHPEFSDCAFNMYEAHFAKIHRTLAACQEEEDKLWKAALKMFRFGETKGLSGTCLGYSKSTHGAAFGKVLSQRAIRWAKEVIDLGVRDPELFSVMSVFEDGIGPDRISDMVVNIALDCIISFNERIVRTIEEDTGRSIPMSQGTLSNRNVYLPINPFTGSPIILVASDVLRHLPIMDNAKSLAKIAEENEDLRARVNEHIGSIFKIRTKKEKDAIRADAMRDAQSFQTLLDLLKILEKHPYDVAKDPIGLLEWRHNAQNFTAIHPLQIVVDQTLSEIEQINCVVEEIINQFRHLVENCRLSRTFYVDQEPRHERYAQMLFFAVAHSYCLANNLDISPESDGGAGPVDFKFSRGTKKILVEIKLSTNQGIVKGFKKQLDAYTRAELSQAGHYVVIDVGRMGKNGRICKRCQRRAQIFPASERLT